MNCVSCRALILPDEPTESCDHGFKCEACMIVSCPECDHDATAMEPDHDDSVKCCPDCERPNQFGEQCESCRQEEQAELALEVFGTDPDDFRDNYFTRSN